MVWGWGGGTGAMNYPEGVVNLRAPEGDGSGGRGMGGAAGGCGVSTSVISCALSSLVMVLSRTSLMWRAGAPPSHSRTVAPAPVVLHLIPCARTPRRRWQTHPSRRMVSILRPTLRTSGKVRCLWMPPCQQDGESRITVAVAVAVAGRDVPPRIGHTRGCLCWRVHRAVAAALLALWHGRRDATPRHWAAGNREARWRAPDWAAEALDAAAASVAADEADPAVTSVGYGGLSRSDGVLELDAALMGRGGELGAVVALSGVRAAVAVAAALARGGGSHLCR